MSREKPERTPMISLVDRTERAFSAHMVRRANALGRPDIKPAHNALFAILGREGERATTLAARAGVTRQSMGEVVRDLVGLGILETVPDPRDGRAKIVRYTAEGLRLARGGRRHLLGLEETFAAEFGEDYEIARTVLERTVSLLAELDDFDPEMTTM